MNNKLPMIIAVSLALASCGSPVPRKELQNLPALIEIVSLNLAQQEAEIRITHRHKDTRENNQLNCQLAIQDQQPWSFSAQPLPDLTTYATERISTRFTGPTIPDTEKPLPYVLDCFVFSENFRREQVIKKGQLYPTPGQPGFYR